MQDQPSAALIPLRTRNGHVRAWAIVDEPDHEWLSQWRWCLHARGYAMRAESQLVSGRQKFRGILMHRAILGLERGDVRHSDHINRDRLDNRRANLRIVTLAQNNQNVGSKGRTSIYRGVSWHRGWWIAQAMIDRKNYRLGRYKSELDAAAAAARFRQQTMPFSEEAREAAAGIDGHGHRT